MRTVLRSPGRRHLLAALSLAVIACEAPTGSDVGPSLERLALAPITDSGGTPYVPDSSDSGDLGDGYFHGTLMGPGAVGGNDSLTFKPRIADATVRIYQVLELRDALPPKIGPAVATIHTDAEGRFVSPVLESHHDGYVVVFTPPASSPYASVWTYAWIGPNSHIHPWWVTAPLR